MDIKQEMADLRKAYNALTAIRKRNGWRGFETALNWLLPKIEEDETREMKAAEEERQPTQHRTKRPEDDRKSPLHPTTDAS